MRKVIRHWLSEDGIKEICKPQNTVLQGTAEQCDYCARMIHPGEDITVATARSGETYILHRGCAEASCQII